MIIVRVELWSAVNGEKTELARMVIDNIGGTMQRGDYRARTLRGRSREALDRALLKADGAGTQRKGKVLGHPRLREHVWNLVAKALSGMGYGQGAAIAKGTALADKELDTAVKLDLVDWQGRPHCVYLDDFRIAGGKPWGGGTSSRSWNTSLREIIRSSPVLQRALGFNYLGRTVDGDAQ